MTFSIVARDPETGQLGVAVQSHFFSVGSVVPWAKPGVGVVATQAIPLVAFGPSGLRHMASGASARDALDAVASSDDQLASRQVGMVAADGSAAAHTGDDCIPVAAHHVGDGVAIQGNILANDDVIPAMVTAWTDSPGAFAERLVGVLAAAQEQGGDLRGQQSASLLVVAGERTDEPWAQPSIRLHVEDHPAPIDELARMVSLRRAYDALESADELLADGDLGAARDAYVRAAELAPDQGEMRFWAAVSLFTAGDHDRARATYRDLVGAEPQWQEVLRRLAATTLFPDDVVELGA